MSKEKKTQKQASIAMLSKRALKHVVSFTRFVDELRLRFVRGEGLYMIAVDPAHVAMRVALLNPGWGLVIDNDHELGIDLHKLQEVSSIMVDGESPFSTMLGMSYLKSGERIALDWDHRHYKEVKPVDVLTLSDPKVPRLKLVATYVLNVEEIDASLKQCEALSNHITLTGSPEKLVIRCEGEEDTYEGRFPGTCDRWDKEMAKGRESIRSHFSVDYFSSAVRTHKYLEHEAVQIHLGDNYPLKMVANGAWGDEYEYEDMIMLAPRIEDE